MPREWVCFGVGTAGCRVCLVSRLGSSRVGGRIGVVDVLTGTGTGVSAGGLGGDGIVGGGECCNRRAMGKGDSGKRRAGRELEPASRF